MLCDARVQKLSRIACCEIRKYTESQVGGDEEDVGEVFGRYRELDAGGGCALFHEACDASGAFVAAGDDPLAYFGVPHEIEVEFKQSRMCSSCSKHCGRELMAACTPKPPLAYGTLGLYGKFA